MTTLVEPYRIGELRLPNRVVMAPMTRARAAAGGLATPSMAAYYPFTPGLRGGRPVPARSRAAATVSGIVNRRAGAAQHPSVPVAKHQRRPSEGA
jgi:hypothetical protein